MCGRKIAELTKERAKRENKKKEEGTGEISAEKE